MDPTEAVEAASLTVVIARDPQAVFDFFVDPRNLPRWARTKSACPADDGWWTLDTPRGAARVRFRADRASGIADHEYESGGRLWTVPARVVALGAASALVLTLFRPAGMSATDFQHQLESVERELHALRQALEG